VSPRAPAGVHDHVDLVLGDLALRLRDPRRFGAMLWCETEVLAHPLLKHLGPEPLTAAFDGAYLHRITRTRKQAIKQVLLDNAVVVGVGNIYANESLFKAGIRPRRAANRLTRAECDALAQAVKATLEAAIEAGGSSLRDFFHADGATGYFQQQYFVYGRDEQPCRRCKSPIRRIVQGQRASFYCPKCQS